MSKVLIGIVLGAILGAFDSMTALLTPEAGNIWEIMPWSSLKGLIVGLIAGYYARKINNLQRGIIYGLIAGMVMSLLVVIGNIAGGVPPYWIEIMVPGAIIGAILGYATQKYGKEVQI
ncbi:MAG: hypothetical protein ACE5I1_23260 [bacterium]